MAKQNFGSIASSSGGSSSAGSSQSYGRVVDIILDSDHPRYFEFGEGLAINGVFVRYLTQTRDEDLESNPIFIHQGSPTFKKIPLIGEVVKIESIPAPILEPTRAQRGGKSMRLVYTDIVNTWNTPEHNAYPNTKTADWQSTLFGKEFKEAGTVNPLQSFPGDVLMEGRHGQSIRLTGTQHELNELVDASNNGKPLFIISNGQKETDNGLEIIVEDVNEDAASIYLTSDHSIPLEAANTRQKSYKEKPDSSSAFKGEQVLINSGRLFFNAKSESILLAAKKTLGGSANSIHLDGNEFVTIDAPRVYLGEKAFKDSDSIKEPLIKGLTAEKWLEDNMDIFIKFAKFLQTLPPLPSAAIPKLIAYGGILQGKLVPLKKRIPRLKSKKVFTE